MPAFRRLVQVGGLWKETGPLLVAGAAILPTPAQVAAWFNRSQLRWFHGPYDPITAVLARHDAAWLGELGARLAKDLRADGVGHYHLAATLIGISGAPVPTSDNFVRRWAGHRFRAAEPPSLAELRSDPFLIALLPRLFDVDGLGPMLETGVWEKRGDSSPSAAAVERLVALADEGFVARSVLLEGTVGRLLRGDTPAALRPFVELHRRLRPTLDELAAHVADYLRLLPVTRVLRRLDRSGCVADPRRGRPAVAGCPGRGERGGVLPPGEGPVPGAAVLAQGPCRPRSGTDGRGGGPAHPGDDSSGPWPGGSGTVAGRTVRRWRRGHGSTGAGGGPVRGQPGAGRPTADRVARGAGRRPCHRAQWRTHGDGLGACPRRHRSHVDTDLARRRGAGTGTVHGTLCPRRASLHVVSAVHHHPVGRRIEHTGRPC